MSWPRPRSTCCSSALAAPAMPGRHSSPTGLFRATRRGSSRRRVHRLRRRIVAIHRTGSAGSGPTPLRELNSVALPLARRPARVAGVGPARLSADEVLGLSQQIGERLAQQLLGLDYEPLDNEPRWFDGVDQPRVLP